MIRRDALLATGLELGITGSRPGGGRRRRLRGSDARKAGLPSGQVVTGGLKRDDVGLVLPAVALPGLLGEASGEQDCVPFAQGVAQIGGELAPRLGGEPDRLGIVPALLGAVGGGDGDTETAVGTGIVPDTGQGRIGSDDALDGEVELTSHEGLLGCGRAALCRPFTTTVLGPSLKCPAGRALSPHLCLAEGQAQGCGHTAALHRRG